MDFLIAAHGVRYGGTTAGEGRRVEDDRVEARDDSFVRFDGGMGFEPVKYIDGFERAFVREFVRGGDTGGGGDGVRALVQHVNMRGSGAGGMQTEPA